MLAKMLTDYNYKRIDIKRNFSVQIKLTFALDTLLESDTYFSVKDTLFSMLDTLYDSAFSTIGNLSNLKAKMLELDGDLLIKNSILASLEKASVILTLNSPIQGEYDTITQGYDIDLTGNDLSKLMQLNFGYYNVFADMVQIPSGDQAKADVNLGVWGAKPEELLKRYDGNWHKALIDLRGAYEEAKAGRDQGKKAGMIKLQKMVSKYFVLADVLHGGE